MTTNLNRALILGFVSLLMLSGCSSPGDRAPRPTPVAATLCGSSQEAPALDEVVERLGFALSPNYIPDGFQAPEISIHRAEARLIFQNPQNVLIIAYPIEFSPEDTPLMRQIGLIRPEDAVSEIALSGETGYMMRGGWSDETIQAGPGIDPAEAEWDYGKSLTLFFDCQIADEREIGVAVQALDNFPAWISDTELTKIALSLAVVSAPQEAESN